MLSQSELRFKHKIVIRVRSPDQPVVDRGHVLLAKALLTRGLLIC